jgi:proton-translocating NADH-quinone oxidoreductase chain N
MMIAANEAFLWLLALPLVASPFIYLAGRIWLRTHPENPSAGPARWLALLVVLTAWVPLAILAQKVMRGEVVRHVIGTVQLQMDGISLLLAFTALALGTLVLLFSVPYMAGDMGEEKYYALLPAMIGAMIGLGSSADLFNLWVWFELMAVSSYLLVSFYTEQRASLEAGVKYLVQSALGSVFILFGIALIFAQVGTLSFAEMGAWVGTPTPVTLGAGALFLIGFGVKAAMVPMHTWLPDAHAQAPSGISAMLSGVVIEAGLIAMLRVLGALPGDLPGWGLLLLGFGGVNVLLGNLMALRQSQVKRMLAYSSLSHVGYMLLGFGAAMAFQAGEAAQGGFFHLLTHALMKGMAFLAAGALLYSLHIAHGSHRPLTVDDLNGASRRYPLAALALSLAVLSLAGLPPLAGFMSKWQIFAGSAETRSLPVILLVVFMAINSVISLGYYAPLVNRMYRREPSEAVQKGRPSPAMMALPLVAMLFFVVVLGLWPALASGITAPAAAALWQMFGGIPAVAGY